MIEELVREKDKWHRRYNDALIENAKLTAENESLILAIKKLIEERDTAMAQRHIRFIGRHWYGITYHDSNRIPKSDKTLWSTQKSILIGYIRQLQEKIDSIVHCKDCKYWAECTFAQPTKDYCGRLIQADYNNHNFGFEMDADDFCSKGEKK